MEENIEFNKRFKIDSEFALKNIERNNKNKQIIENERNPPKTKTNKFKLLEEDMKYVVDFWDTTELPRIFNLYEPDKYNKIELVVTREIKRKNFIMPFDLLVFAKKYNNKVVEYYSKDKNYKQVLDILYEGIYTIIDNVINKNNIKKENAKILDLFDVENIRDYNLAFKRISSRYATKIRDMQLNPKK
jgi:hypothetical protein